MVGLRFLDLPERRWLAVRAQAVLLGVGQRSWVGRLVLILGLHLVLPGGARGQIDPLLYAPVGAAPRLAVSLAVAPDGAVLADGTRLETLEQTLQVSLEHPLGGHRALQISLAGSHFAARLDGAPSERRLSLDQVGWGLIQATEWRWLGDQQLWSLEAYLPLGPAPGRVGYGLEARAVWLQDPLAWEVAASAQAAPGRPVTYGWSGGATFLANRHASVAVQIDVIDRPHEAPTTVASLTLYRHPALPGQPLWGWGGRQAIQAGQARPSFHLVWGWGW